MRNTKQIIEVAAGVALIAVGIGGFWLPMG